MMKYLIKRDYGMDGTSKSFIVGGIIAIIIGLLINRQHHNGIKMNRLMNFIFNIASYLGLFHYIGNWNWLNKYVTIRLR